MPQITIFDYDAYQRKELTAADLCYRYNLSLQAVYNQLRAWRAPQGSPRQFMTSEDRANLKADLLAAIPHDRVNGIKQVLIAYRLKSISQALALLKVKSLSELRGNRDLGIVLRRLNLRLVQNILYSPKNHGRKYENRQIVLDSEALVMLTSDPVKWIRANINEVRETCYRQGRG